VTKTLESDDRHHRKGGSNDVLFEQFSKIFGKKPDVHLFNQIAGHLDEYKQILDVILSSY
jgi:hypothetical protein